MARAERHFVEMTFPAEARVIIRLLEELPGKYLAEKLDRKSAAAIFPRLGRKNECSLFLFQFDRLSVDSNAEENIGLPSQKRRASFRAKFYSSPLLFRGVL
ncbi:MAG TPA: hypothetical protein DD435_10825 [Cyanobacteria bacterium UBA8530]|nr:hypothetical protein [Cyanobacteria bacterium UBA8530]